MSTKNLQILDSLIPSYDETLSETSTNAVQTKVVAEAVSDLNTRVDETVESVESLATDSASTYETKTDANIKLETAKTYIDSAVAQKTQVQIITWEDDD